MTGLDSYMNTYLDKRMSLIMDEWQLATQFDTADLERRLPILSDDIRSLDDFEKMADVKMTDLAFFIYYFFRGTAGPVAITRPLESRVDEYLDRRLDLLIDEYSLITQPKVRKFRAEKEKPLTEEEAKVATLKQFEQEMTATMTEMEKRLDVLEKELAGE